MAVPCRRQQKKTITLSPRLGLSPWRQTRGQKNNLSLLRRLTVTVRLQSTKISKRGRESAGRDTEQPRFQTGDRRRGAPTSPMCHGSPSAECASVSRVSVRTCSVFFLSLTQFSIDSRLGEKLARGKTELAIFYLYKTEELTQETGLWWCEINTFAAPTWTDMTMILMGGFVETLPGHSAALPRFPSQIPEWKQVQIQRREILELSLAAVREVLGITEVCPRWTSQRVSRCCSVGPLTSASCFQPIWSAAQGFNSYQTLLRIASQGPLALFGGWNGFSPQLSVDRSRCECLRRSKANPTMAWCFESLALSLAFFAVIRSGQTNDNAHEVWLLLGAVLLLSNLALTDTSAFHCRLGSQRDSTPPTCDWEGS